MYKSIPDGFKVINATEGLKGFTIVSTSLMATQAAHGSPKTPHLWRDQKRRVLTLFCLPGLTRRYFRAGSLPSLATELRASESSAFTKCSRMSIKQPSVKKLLSTRPSVSLFPPLVLRSSPTPSSAPGKL